MPLIDPVTMSGMSSASQSRPLGSSMSIDLLPTALVGSNYASPVILLSAFYLRFPALVADPVSALLQGLIPVAVCQGAYCLYCLPVAGTNSRMAKKTIKGKGGATKKAGDGSLLPTKATHLILSLLLTAFSVPMLFTIQVLLGAPVTSNLPQTLLSSAHLALLAVLPLVYVHGIDSSKWLEVLSAQSPFDEVFGAAVGAGVGAWLGAVPIPLDWDREWQKWPVTIVTGIYVGWAIGKVFGGSILKGKRIEFD